jgi:mono/diheme cytochrome c family protein
MLRTLSLLIVLGLLAGCGGSGTPESGATAAKAPRSAAGPDPSGSQLNSGPKAATTVTLNPGLADFGEQAFQKRACVTCHAIGQTKQGPDLTGVAYRRTEAWMTRQIKDPDWMVKNDPIARELMAKYALQMANQQVPDQEIKAIIHYLVRETLKNPETASR